MGSNDCLNNYLMPNFPTPSQFKAEHFGDILTFYNLDGRKSCKSPGAKFIYLNIAHMFDEIIANPASYGFTTLDKGCCGIVRNRAHISLVFPMRHLVLTKFEICSCNYSSYEIYLNIAHMFDKIIAKPASYGS
ncbi:hypothetical protein HID58_047186 [Brassica napus]|uniref:Uncharacterized protein n=1 Tax=Brassica napus TaxID=3708 RepID=A0ABQ8AYQ8_BRANA|nr:hypothetical protein HID58_047186 [Brassica napus]